MSVLDCRTNKIDGRDPLPAWAARLADWIERWAWVLISVLLAVAFMAAITAKALVDGWRGM